MNKLLTFTVPVLCLVSSFSFATENSNPCQAVAADFADKELHQMYPGRQYQKEEIGLGNVNFEEDKGNGFQVWSVEYNVDEECLDGFNMLLRASRDGQSCAFIKTMNSGASRDCG